MRAAWIALTTVALAGTANADCIGLPGKVLLARPVRCESSDAYVYAARTAGAPSDASDAREELCRPEGAGIQRSETIVVLWAVSQLDLEWGAGGEGALPLTARGEWRPVLEPARYSWPGTLEECRALERGAFLRFRVVAPCCDTIPASDVSCYSGLFIAARVTSELDAVLPAKAKEPLRLEDDLLLQFFELRRDPEAGPTARDGADAPKLK